MNNVKTVRNLGDRSPKRKIFIKPPPSRFRDLSGRKKKNGKLLGARGGR